MSTPDPRPSPAESGSAGDGGAPDSTDAGDRPSVTEVGGSIARFAMSYSPPADDRAKTKFGPPLRTRVPSALYLLGAIVLGAVVTYAYEWAPSSSRVFGWVVEGDTQRPIAASVLATIVVVSALGTVLRTHMRGVLVSEDWIEARTLLAFGVPRSRRWGWPQVNRVVVDRDRVALELYDGSFERLPEVARGGELVALLVQKAQRRRIDVTSLDAPGDPG